MRIGIVFPQTEIGADPVAVRDYAQLAEELGFSHLSVFDHVLGVDHRDRDAPLVGGYTDGDTFHEPLTLFSYWSGLTSSIEFTTAVLVLPQRQTALVAKQAAQVQLLSQGRLRLGVGVGWNHVEYRGMGQKFGTRGVRQEEQIELLRALWTEELVSRRGRFDDLDRVAIAPRPPSPIPIWLGGLGERAFDRAARIAEGFIFTHFQNHDSGMTSPIAAAIDMRARVEANGRDPASFGLDGRVALTDGMDSVSAAIDSFVEAGFDHVSVNVMNAGLHGPEQHLRALTSLAGEAGLVPPDNP